MEEEMETDLLTPVCLPVDPDIEYTDFPSNGHEFLLKVMQERQKCPTIATCNIKELSSKQSVFAVETPPVKDAPSKLKPTVEWQNIQVADFSTERMYISKLLADKSIWPPIEENQYIIEINMKKKLEASVWIKLFESEVPSLSCILGINQCKIENGLSVLVYSLKKIPEGATIPKLTGQWIYAILAYIQLPLLSETISILRDLARRCAEIRSYIDPGRENAVADAAPLNLFICLITKYFGQTDLMC